jgi:hypothetical protein
VCCVQPASLAVLGAPPQLATAMAWRATLKMGLAKTGRYFLQFFKRFDSFCLWRGHHDLRETQSCPAQPAGLTVASKTSKSRRSSQNMDS